MSESAGCSQVVADRFLATATAVPGFEGCAWTGHLSLVALLRQLGGNTVFDDEGPIDILEADTGFSIASLVDFTVRNPGPPDWHWSLCGLRVADHGFVLMVHEEFEEPPGIPVFAAWTPWDDQDAFEAAFAAGVTRFFDEFIGLGTHFSLGDRVSLDLWRATLARALADPDAWRWLDPDLERDRLSNPVERARALDEYLATRRRDWV